MKMTDSNYTSALSLSASIEAGDLPITELMKTTLDRIDEVNGAVSAIVSIGDCDTLMSEAQKRSLRREKVGCMVFRLQLKIWRMQKVLSQQWGRHCLQEKLRKGRHRS